MPLKSKDYPVAVGLRLSAEQAEKLDSLSAATGLQRNALLRHLIERAQPSAFPAIDLGIGQPSAEALEGDVGVAGVGVDNHAQG